MKTHGILNEVYLDSKGSRGPHNNSPEAQPPLATGLAPILGWEQLD